MCLCAASVQSCGDGPASVHVLRGICPSQLGLGGTGCGATRDAPTVGSPGEPSSSWPLASNPEPVPAQPRDSSRSGGSASGWYRTLLRPSAPLRGRRLCRPSLAGSCPEAVPHLAPWRPGSDPRRADVLGQGAALLLESSTEFHSLVIRDGGSLVFADRPHGPPITLRARYILIQDGGKLHIGSERCPHSSRATISLYGRSAEGAAVEGFVGMGRGGVLVLHGQCPRFWTFLDKNSHAGGLPYGPYSSEKRWGSRGLNLRILDSGTGRVLAAGRFDTHLRSGECRWLIAFLARPAPGRLVAAAVGDSAARSLTLEAQLLLRDLLGSRFMARLGYRQPLYLHIGEVIDGQRSVC